MILATNVVPLTDHIVLKAVEQEEVTSSGLVIPDSAKEAPQHGHVVAVGPGKLSDTGQMIDIDLAEGDNVLYQKYIMLLLNYDVFMTNIFVLLSKYNFEHFGSNLVFSFRYAG